MFVSPKIHVEALTPYVMVFGGGSLRVIRFRWGPEQISTLIRR